MLHSGNFHNGRLPGFPSDDNIRTFLDNLEHKWLNGKKLFMGLGGGEPTLHPMFAEIVERCEAMGTVTISTNGTRPIEWWQSLKVLPKKVIISLHPEFTKIEKVNEVSLFLIDKGVYLQFNLSTDPDNWTGVESMYNGIDESIQHKIIPKVLNYMGVGSRQNYNYSQEQKNKMDIMLRKMQPMGDPSLRPTAYYDDGSSSVLPGLHQLTINNQNIFTGWECEAGQFSFNVHFDGNVWSSICKIKKLGRIESFVPLAEPLICTHGACISPGDLISSKRKI
jgi:MoaA/NifB/PqqE/SkfB family radical SAM enzyme